MSFDDDAAGDVAGFRPPPHPDDRLWRHPSELTGGPQVGLAPPPRHPWPWAVVAVVGTATVLLAGAGALVLGFRDDPGGDELVQQVDTTMGAAPTVAPQTWLGIEGYDQAPLAGTDEASGDPRGETGTSATTAVAPTVPTADDAPDGNDATSSGSDATSSGDLAATTTTSASTPGVLVGTVDPEGPVAHTLQPGDKVIEVDGRPIANMDELQATLGQYQPGDQVLITYIPADGSQGPPKTVLVTLGERPADLSTAPASGGGEG